MDPSSSLAAQMLDDVTRAQIARRVLTLASRLVAQPSTVGTDGERVIAELLFAHLQAQLPAGCTAQLKLVPAGPDAACASVLALLPAAAPTSRTLVLMGHFDTVGTEPYGSLAASALDSAALKAAYRDSADSELALHARSDDWAFGRGWLDMKGGVAAVVEVFLHFAQSRSLNANLLLLLTGDEEAESRGLRSLLPRVRELTQSRSLELLQVVNADYCSPLSDGDDSRYVYSGTVGKALIGLSVFGLSTHAGEPYSGLNAGALAARLATGLELSRKLLAGSGGEWLPPPTLLSIRDRRENYDVMTTGCAELYINLFHLGRDSRDGWHDLLQEVRRLVRLWNRELRLRIGRIARRTNLRLPLGPGRTRVIDYAALLQRVERSLGGSVEAELARIKHQASTQHADSRERALAIVRALHALLGLDEPLVVVSLLPPYYPAQVAPKDSTGGQHIARLCSEHGLKLRRIYPYISDMSYFSFGSDDLAEQSRQAPLWFDDDELALLREMSTPVCNIGPWGIGAHTAFERVHLPFLTERLPGLLIDALQRLAD